MKDIPAFLILLNLVFSLNSCEKDDDGNVNFYDAEYRTGLWINAIGPDRKDTLHFVDNLNLIRSGNFYVHEEYLYRVDGKNLFIRLPGTTSETQHPIMVVDKKTVVLGNMYITIGFGDGSGTFLKED